MAQSFPNPSTPHGYFGQSNPNASPYALSLHKGGYSATDAYTGREIQGAPYGGHYRMATHATAFPDPRLILQRALISAFMRPDDICQALYPLRYYNGEKIHIREWIAKNRAFGPLAAQAGLEQYELTQRSMEFEMVWFGAQAVVDDTVARTDLAGFLEGVHKQQLNSGMNLTMWTEGIRHTLAVPNIYQLEYYYNTEKRMPQYTEFEAFEAQKALLERMPGILQRQGPDNSMADFVSKAQEILSYTRVLPELQASVLILSRDLLSWVTKTTSRFKSEMSEVQTQRIFKQLGVDPEFQYNLAPVALPTVKGLKVLPVELLDLEGGMINPLLNDRRFGQWWLIDPNTMEEFYVPDYDARTWRLVYKRSLTGNAADQFCQAAMPHIQTDTTTITIPDSYLTVYDTLMPSTTTGLSTLASKMAGTSGVYRTPTLPHLVAFRPSMHFKMLAAAVCIGGSDTGEMFIGEVNYDEFHSGDLRRTTYMNNFRMAMVIYHPEHIVLVPDASFQRAVGGLTGKRWRSSDESVVIRKVVRNIDHSSSDSPAQQHVHLNLLLPAAGGKYYAQTFSQRKNQRNTNGDVFVYAIPPITVVESATFQNPDTNFYIGSLYQEKIQELQAGTILNCGGSWGSEIRGAENQTQYNWLLEGNSAMQTFLKTRDELTQLCHHGMGRNENNLCFRGPARVKYFDSVTGKANDKWEYLTASAGPLEPSDMNSADRWNGRSNVDNPSRIRQDS